MKARFVEGQTYRLDEIIGHVWGDLRTAQALPPDTRFRYEQGVYGSGSFVEVVEPPNPLVSSELAQRHVEELRQQGLTYRQISRLAGVAVESVYRAATGVGLIRESTESALLQVSNGNGITKPKEGELLSSRERSVAARALPRTHSLPC
jgi:hypothetical protein